MLLIERLTSLWRLSKDPKALAERLGLRYSIRHGIHSDGGSYELDGHRIDFLGPAYDSHVNQRWCNEYDLRVRNRWRPQYKPAEQEHPEIVKPKMLQRIQYLCPCDVWIGSGNIHVHIRGHMKQADYWNQFLNEQYEYKKKKLDEEIKRRSNGS